MSKHIAIIVEGIRREINYWKSIENVFFSGTSLDIVPLSADKNIYMIWNIMRADCYETDIIEILRENSASAKIALDGYCRDDFQEIYLFFDYDPQQNNLGLSDKDYYTVLSEMMQTFDNETENGKLYFSYPMCEALRDLNGNSCASLTACFFPYDLISEYKSRSGLKSKYADHRKYDFETWKIFIATFVKRTLCLFDKYDSSSLQWYKSFITPIAILKRENMLFEKRKMIFVLSAFSEFLLDYYPKEHFPWLPDIVQSLSEDDCAQKDVVQLNDE